MFSAYLSKLVSEESLEAFAKESGFQKRKSKVSPKAFLETVFFSSADKSPSLSDYCIDFQHSSDKSISKQGIDKRFNESLKAMLKKLVEEVIAKQISRKANLKGAGKYFTEIRLMDSTEFKLSKNVAGRFPGYGLGREALGQVQFEFDLLSGKVKQLDVGSGLNSDVTAGLTEIDKVPEQSLLIRDLGYFHPKTFQNLQERKIYYISRAKSQWNFYLRDSKNYHRITTLEIIEKLKAQKQKYLDIEVFVGEKLKVPMRLIANLLTEQQAQKRIKKKTDRLGKLGKDALEGSRLNLFVSNIEKEKCDANSIYELYRLRWQIELIFKTWKSIMNLHKIHTMNALRLECLLWIKLLWVLLNWSMLLFLQRFSKVELSFHKLSRIMLSRKAAIRMDILDNTNLLKRWLNNLVETSKIYSKKEYKKGSKSNDLFNLTFL